ncbi:putative serine protease PepD [Humibacillus xanthopallidus]|uniref:Putative serine protease PepD n=1 Tax=Humibacillus xanthopallidus TaxID=412689 RepID=A0A543PY75_9MICO|nr:trypsin-like peptidase domain-containing protein [Humibacillus xanthopallidus]TQN49025.1 putative serine protease PepD [Humibacillus xanthopallidus]
MTQEPDAGRGASTEEPPATVAPGRGWLPTGVKAGPAVAVVLAAALVGGAVGALLATRLADIGSNRACPAIDVAADTLPSVVTVLTAGPSGSGNGTGELIRTGGYVLTNDHVIAAAVTSGGAVGVRYGDGVTTTATVVGRDPVTDLAVIKAADAAKDRPLIRIGDSATLRVGQPVVALGAPLGLSSTVTSGIVSALGRHVPLPTGGGTTAHLLDAVQTDAAINPGNSGGPLVGCSGAMVGVNTAIATAPNEQGVSGGGSVGVGFAIPMGIAIPIADSLIDTGRAGHPDLGLNAQAMIVEGKEAVPTGLYVSAVTPGGPAAQAGIRAGDIILTVDGQSATSVDQLVLAALTRAEGDTVPFTISRGGARSDVTVTLGPAP